MDRYSMKFGRTIYRPMFLISMAPASEIYRTMFTQMEKRIGQARLRSYLGYRTSFCICGRRAQSAYVHGGHCAHNQAIRLGVARLMFLPLHNPINIAESYAMVDVISNGRLDFGVGKGSRIA